MKHVLNERLSDGLSRQLRKGQADDIQPGREADALDARILALGEGRESGGNEEADNEQQSGYLTRAASAAKTRKLIHDVHTELSISFMRIRYAWCIFVLLVFWLAINLSIIVAQALHTWNTHYVFVLLWGFGGYFIGGLLGCWFRSYQSIKGICEVYRNSEHHSDVRVEEEEKFIRIRLERGVSVPSLLIFCTVTAMLIAHFCLPASSSIPFSFESSVLVATITSTTTGVIGLFLIVLHWLFPKNKKEENEPQSCR